ncbi:MAG: ROK family protein [Clostridia bacterium]|nr:ROK family protein [Clostridia bacterium]MBR1685990.1 ROK family protein [Clostridia bacterium]MBR2286992.1 ROK family protein [Clostridia bacterium]
MYRIGLDIGGTGIQIGLVDEKGHILERGEIVTNTSAPFSEQVHAMASCVQDLIDRSGYSLLDIASIGAGVPGVADQKTGEVIFCTNLGWTHVPFREEFRKYFDKPVFVDNDATVAGLAESVAGVSAGSSSSVFITIGTGIGSGIIINGRIWSGAHGVGSELGHAILELDGEPCTCGNHGCVERYCSATAIIRMARELLARHPESSMMDACEGDLKKINARIVIDAAREGDPVAIKVFRRFVKALGQTIANVVNILDPEMIVLGGGVAKAGSFLLDAVRAEVPNYILYKDLPFARIELARLGADAGIIGAAMLS